MGGWRPGIIVTLAGWAVTWPLLWLLVRAFGDPSGFPFRAGVSAMAWWLVTVLFALSAADVRNAWGGTPADRLPLWHRPWVPAAIVLLGIGAGWAGWK